MAKTNKDSWEYSYGHTAERMFSRHGFTLSIKEYNELCENYRRSKYKVAWLEPQNDQVVFIAKFKEKLLWFTWCNRRNRITTVLTGGRHE